MHNSGSVSKLLLGLKAGGSTAIRGLWERYYSRLVGLARKRLADSPRRVADEEDVALAAFDSFCRGAAAGRFPQLEDRDDLWRVLVVLTVRKALNQRTAERTAKRGGGAVRGDSVFAGPDPPSGDAGFAQMIGDEPTPDLAASVAEEVGRLLDRLNDRTLRSVAVWKMEGHTNEEIGKLLGCQRRTIDRKLRLIREILDADSGAT